MKYALVNGAVLDGRLDMQPQRGMAVVIDGDRIADIVPDGEAGGCQRVDVGGGYIMPGLINLHIHLPSSGKPKKKPSDPVKLVGLLNKHALVRAVVLKMCENLAKTQLMSGVTTVRTVGGVRDFDTTIRNRINEGRLVGPRVLASDMAVSVPGGHMAGSLAHVAKSAEDAVKYVDLIAEGKPDLIKLMITGGVLDAKVKGEPGELKMPPEYVKAACDEAHRLGFKVAAHVESPQGIIVALENGVDTIEHGAEPNERMMQLFKEKGAALVCTISPALPFALFDQSVSRVSDVAKYNGEYLFKGIINCAKECLENGIAVGLGTDTGCPYITHYDMWREVYYFAKYCGVSNSFALHTATEVNAGILGMGDVTGTLEKGKCADIIVTDKNPLDDLSALRNVKTVITRGKLISSPRVKKMPEVEAELDKFM